MAKKTNAKEPTFVNNLGEKGFAFEREMPRADRLPEDLIAVIPAEPNRKITKRRASGGRGIGE